MEYARSINAKNGSRISIHILIADSLTKLALEITQI